MKPCEGEIELSERREIPEFPALQSHAEVLKAGCPTAPH